MCLGSVFKMLRHAAISDALHYCKLLFSFKEVKRIYVRKSLGSGGFGIVYKAVLTEESDTKMCLKMVSVIYSHYYYYHIP